MNEGDTLKMWTVYNHPSDFPNSYVARLFRIGAGQAIATATVLLSDDLELLRKDLASAGLVRLSRAEGDDSVILETWL